MGPLTVKEWRLKVTTSRVVVFKSPSELLPGEDDPEWYGLPVLQFLSEGLSAADFELAGEPEQYEDADGGFLVRTGQLLSSVHLIFLDMDRSLVTWAALVSVSTGCLSLRAVDPGVLRPLLVALHVLLTREDRYRLVGWYPDVPVEVNEDDPAREDAPFPGWRECL